MKIQPDETTLTRWIDGELEGEELRRVEAYAAEHPGLLAERDAIRAMNAGIRENVPASVEPPYADFFNQRILRHIEAEQAREAPAPAAGSRRGLWQWFAVPAAAAAMALCFYLGTRVSEPATIVAAPAKPAAAVPTVYTPDGGVEADMFRAEDAGATVIVLKGLEDIPDDLEMVGEPGPRTQDAAMVSTGTFY